MADMTILTWPHPMLARDCDPVGECDSRTRQLAEDMLTTMYAAEGRGLAAPQVGVPVRVFVMDATWKAGVRAPQVFIDPEITWTSPETLVQEERCLSLPGIAARVERPAQVHMRWSDPDGTLHDEDLHGFAALCAQHELDHLDGIVTLDRLDRQTRNQLLEGYAP